MRIIAGRAKGVRLLSPAGLDIRPTLDRVRESVFNILAPRLNNARFADLFAGTGANGIEALSRGAASAVFVDVDRRALEIIRENLTKTKLGGAGLCVRGRMPEDLGLVRGPFDIVFADPPYAFAGYGELLEALGRQQLLELDGVIVLEHERRNRPPETVGNLRQYRQQHYGDTWVSFYS